MPLTDTACKNAKSLAKAYKKTDGGAASDLLTEARHGVGGSAPIRAQRGRKTC